MLIAGKYDVLSEIGRGAMGVVYKVRHVALGAMYAVKTLPTHLAEDPELVARFQQEARVMAALHHPNIVRVVDVGDEGRQHFLVMEYVEGESLDKLLRRSESLPLSEVLTIGMQVGAALRHAHSHAPVVIHRDIKPSNILIEHATGQAIVTDFGIAKILGATSVVHTKTGAVVGTLKYCAPEQLHSGREIDARADVYSLGLVIYEMLTGRHPLRDLDEPQVVARAVDETTEHPLEFNSESPVTMQRVIKRAVAKSRDKRYPTVNALLADLARVQVSVATGTPTTTVLSNKVRNGRGLRTWIIAAAALAMIAAAVFFSGLEAQRSGWWSAAGRTLAERLATGNGAARGPRSVERQDPSPIAAKVRAIGIMDFTAWVPDTNVAWMRDVIRDNLSSQLSSAPDCKVFSKEFIDFKAQTLLRKGTYSDLRAATMEIAEQLGVTKAIFGHYRAEGPELRIEAYVVDMLTGVQEPADRVEGDLGKFGELQRELAAKIMARLDIASSSAAAIARKADLDGYKLLFGAEGGSTEEQKRAPKGGSPGDSLSRRGSPIGSIVIALAERLDVPSVFASDAADDDSRRAILDTIQKYRQAYEAKDLTLLAEVYGTLTAEQANAAAEYFKNAKGLKVTIDDIDIAIDVDQAAVSYTRRDRFTDAKTGEDHVLQVRLTKLLVRGESGWLISPTVK